MLWGDSATFQLRVWRGEIDNPLGLALAHPLYILLARGFAAMLPLGDYAYRVNLFSVVCAAAAVGLVYALLARLIRRPVAALVGTVLLAASHTFWTHAVMAEVYALYALGLAAELCLLERFLTTRRRGWLNAALFVNGLNVSNHLLALLHAPAYLLLLAGMRRRREWRVRDSLPPALFWCAGASLYLAMIAGRVAAGEEVAAVIREALTGRQYARNMTGMGFTWRGDSLKTAAAFALNYPTPLILLAIPGAIGLLKRRQVDVGTALPAPRPGGPAATLPARRIAQWMLALLAVNFAFGFVYTVPDKYVFFFPCYVLLPILVAAGAARWRPAAGPRGAVALLAAALLPALVYEIAPPVLKQRRVALFGVRDLPGREKYAYFLRPRKNGETGAADVAAQAFATVGPGGLLLADSTVKAALVVVRDIGGVGREVLLAEDGDPVPGPPTMPATAANLRRLIAARRCYAFDITTGYLAPAWIADEYSLIRAGPIYRVQVREDET